MPEVAKLNDSRTVIPVYRAQRLVELVAARAISISYCKIGLIIVEAGLDSKSAHTMAKIHWVIVEVDGHISRRLIKNQ